MHRIAIFASGNGSNAQRIIEYFSGSSEVTIALVLCNKPGAFVISRAASLDIPSLLFTRADLYETGRVAAVLKEQRIGFLVLAGFLWLMPVGILYAFPDRIINLHPALLPKYGGRGMYGMKVHEAVIAARESESGITIHYVNEHYDEGQILFQAKCAVLPSDTADTLAEKIHVLEYRWFPEVIEKALLQPGV